MAAWAEGAVYQEVPGTKWSGNRESRRPCRACRSLRRRTVGPHARPNHHCQEHLVEIPDGDADTDLPQPDNRVGQLPEGARDPYSAQVKVESLAGPKWSPRSLPKRNMIDTLTNPTMVLPTPARAFLERAEGSRGRETKSHT